MTNGKKMLFTYETDACGGMTIYSPYKGDESVYLQVDTDVEAAKEELRAIEEAWENSPSYRKNAGFASLEEAQSHYLQNYFPF